MKNIIEYELEATRFLEETGTTIEIHFSHNGKHFDSDTEPRDIYDITLKNKTHSYTFKFGQSIYNSGFYYGNITRYNVLSCLTKYDPETFEYFCGEFGYDTDSRKALKVYEAVCVEWDEVCKLFTDTQIEALREIQ